MSELQRDEIFTPPSGPHIPADTLSLFAMQLLSGSEASAIGQHVDGCPECRRELAQIQGELAIYAISVDLHAPAPGARQRLLKQVAKEKKVIPIAPPAQPPIAAFGRSGSILSMEDRQPKRNVGLAVLGWSGWAVAAGLAVAASFVYKDRDALRGTLSAQAGEVARLTADAAQAHQLMDALTDPKAVRVTLTAKPTPHVPIGRATYNADKGSLIFLASNLDPLQAEKVYELWLIPTEGAPIPAGTFHPDDQGNASVIMPELPKGVAAKGFGITIEDEGGSKTPTLPIVLAGF